MGVRVEEQNRQEELAARKDAERRERERVERETRARREEEDAKQRLQAWLEKNKYSSINTKKSTMMRKKYPLHDAVSQGDADAVRVLLRFGADPSLKNSSGQTPEQVARKNKGSEDVLAVFASQRQVKM